MQKMSGYMSSTGKRALSRACTGRAYKCCTLKPTACGNWMSVNDTFEGVKVLSPAIFDLLLVSRVSRDYRTLAQRQQYRKAAQQQ